MLANVRYVWSSLERKAHDTAAILSERLGIEVCSLAALHENDRSATGYLPAEEFERVADAFFAQPETSVRGWERAVDAQARIVAAVNHVLASSGPGDIAIVTHGAVGMLSYCAFADKPIDRSADQPFQGHFWQFRRDTRAIIRGWCPIAPRKLISDQSARAVLNVDDANALVINPARAEASVA